MLIQGSFSFFRIQLSAFESEDPLVDVLAVFLPFESADGEFLDGRAGLFVKIGDGLIELLLRQLAAHHVEEILGTARDDHFHPF